MRLVHWLDDDERYAAPIEYAKRSLAEWAASWLVVTVGGLFVVDDIVIWLLVMAASLLAILLRTLVNSYWMTGRLKFVPAALVKFSSSVVVVGLVCGGLIWSM